MSAKATIPTLAIICGFTFNPPSRSPVTDLHTIREKDIDSITTSFENHTITIKLKSGITYTYLHADWDMEEYDPSLNQQLQAAIKEVKITFTKVEHPPEFPGGEKGWDKYIAGFCRQHNKEINEKGPADITIQFIVHMKGQITDVSVLLNRDRSDLEALAQQAILDGPPWIPAKQNGYTVVSYARHLVKLSL